MIMVDESADTRVGCPVGQGLKISSPLKNILLGQKTVSLLYIFGYNNIFRYNNTIIRIR